MLKEFGDRNIPLLKLNLGLPPSFALQSRVPKNILVDNSFVQRNVNRVPEKNDTQLEAAKNV